MATPCQEAEPPEAPSRNSEGRRQEEFCVSYFEFQEPVRSLSGWKYPGIACSSHFEGRWENAVSSGQSQGLETDLGALA